MAWWTDFPIKIKRRSVPGDAGPPDSLKSGELAFNENDNILYYGKGDDGDGNATTIVSIQGTSAQFVHTQNSSSATWTVAHNKNKYPQVQVIQSGKKVEVDVEFVDLNTIKIYFDSPQTGIATCD